MARAELEASTSLPVKGVPNEVVSKNKGSIAKSRSEGTAERKHKTNLAKSRNKGKVFELSP
jgi:hypothetical protein